MVVLGCAAAMTLASVPAEAKRLKDCRMDYRFKPPLRTCADPNPPPPYRKPRPVKQPMLKPIYRTVPGLF